jgi:ubiquinone/menaquinone biosynthesis C-methylase UbiE
MTTSDPPAVFKGTDPREFSGQLAAYLDDVAMRNDVRAAHAIANELMGIAPGVRVLDAGCGTGVATAELARAVAPGGEAVGVDLSAGFLAVAERRVTGGLPLRFARGDVTDLPFEDEGFDAVRSERVLQHLSDPDAAIRELMRVTRPGGRVCAIDSDWPSLAVDVGDEHTALAARVLDHFLAIDQGRHALTTRTLRRRYLRAGMTDVAVRVLPFTFTSLSDVAGIFPQFDERVPPVAGVVPDADRDAWFAALRAADAAGKLWVCALWYVVAGTRR